MYFCHALSSILYFYGLSYCFEINEIHTPLLEI
jgi:hypothetical protein